MAAEQDWAAYANQASLTDTDTLLARTAAGAGVEIPGSAFAKRATSGNVETVKGFVALGQTSGWTGPGAFLDLSGGFARLGGYDYSVPGTIEVIVLAPSFRPSADNVTTLGKAAQRWSVVYAATGTINTSDERDKTWRGPMSDGEYAAALQIINELGFYQWNDVVAEKGADARYHFGVRAQRAFDILDNHLGAGAWHSYGFACHDSWGDEFEPVFEEQTVPAVVNAEGVEIEPARTEMVDTGETRKTLEAGDRYGLRTDQFTMFLMAAQARRQTELEQRIAALEA